MNRREALAQVAALASLPVVGGGSVELRDREGNAGYCTKESFLVQCVWNGQKHTWIALENSRQAGGSQQ